LIIQIFLKTQLETVGIGNHLRHLAEVHLLFVLRSVYFGCRSVDRLSAAASPVCVKPTEDQLMSFCPFVQTLAAF